MGGVHIGGENEWMPSENLTSEVVETHWCDIRKGLVAVEKQVMQVRQGCVYPVTTKRTLEMIRLEKETAEDPNEA
jgi:hypothetical protein